uniref:Olfactomedin-like 2Bb n=1 Tax=Gasterosteus aculeatus aculeatus TaxID=481459 RepID=G3PPR8_GASAC
MWRTSLLLLVLCSSLQADPEAPHAAREADHLRQRSPGTDAPVAGPEQSAQQPTARPLEEELDNQENIISQLLGDYDKVKTVSSGSDCVCRCIVRPIPRSHCSGLPSPSGDSYSVETVTKGTDCKKCVCMAPPSAVNPCEGEYRFKKLQEAGKEDIKLATIIELLEGSLYGMDLLKLHSVTTKLLSRVDNVEKRLSKSIFPQMIEAFARNFTERTREKERVKERAKEKEKERKAQQKKKKVNDLERAGQKSGAAPYGNKQKNNDGQKNRLDGLEQQQPTRNTSGSQKPVKEKTEPKKPITDKNAKVIRGVTFYKAEGESYNEDDEKGKGRNSTLTVNASVDLPPPTKTYPTQSPGPSTIVTQLDLEDRSRRTSRPAPNQQPTAAPTSTTIQTTPRFHHPTTSLSDTNTGRPIDKSPTVNSQAGSKSRLSWTESPADQPKTTKKPAVCKDTVASISEPAQQNSYGLSDGAWMRDGRGHGNVIYLTNGHYGNNLLEFRDMETFKSGQTSNSYKLPYSFTGTGHVVFSGAFYYNRAFSRDIIRYDLRRRYVAAWTTLHDAILEEQAHRTQTELEFAVDESGLWLLYPAVDTEGFHQEVTLLLHLRHRDLQPIQSFRTGLRRGRYGNSFLICGVLYAVNSMEHNYANVTYAFDTHTLTHSVPGLAFTNTHAHTSQLAYCPLDKKLYAWDDGHQMIYDVVFAY